MVGGEEGPMKRVAMKGGGGLSYENGQSPGTLHLVCFELLIAWFCAITSQLATFGPSFVGILKHQPMLFYSSFSLWWS